jgi:hypothetical protein
MRHESAFTRRRDSDQRGPSHSGPRRAGFEVGAGCSWRFNVGRGLMGPAARAFFVSMSLGVDSTRSFRRVGSSAVDGGEVVLELCMPELVDGPCLSEHLLVERDLQQTHETVWAVPAN